MTTNIKTMLNQIQKQELAFGLYQKAVDLIKSQRELFLDLGFVLSQIKNQELYKEMGEGGFDTWRSFLANPEISITPSTADVYIKVYEFYIEKLKMPRSEVLEIPLVRLNMMKSKLDGLDENERIDLIEKSKTLSYNDFKIEAINGGVEKKRAIEVHRCDTCQKLIVKYDPDQICDCNGGVDITPY